jgi:lysozyme
MSTAKKAGAGALLLAAAFIIPWEGLWTTAQVDTIGTGRPPTVCYGATRAEIPTLKVGDKFTKGECDELLLKSLPKYANAIAPCIKVPVSDKEFAAFISFSYNVGSAGFCRSSTAALLNRGDHRGACDALMNWTKAQGRVVKGLVNRRTAERKLCLEGIGEPANVPVVKPPASPKKPAPPTPPTFWERIKLVFTYVWKGL